MIAIIDYGAGNLGSVQNALNFLGAASVVTADPAQIARADRLLLPGVGAFPDAMRMLRAAGLWEILRDEVAPRGGQSGKLFLGICLGMQMLFEASDEFEETVGLGLIPGRVSKIEFPSGILSLEKSLAGDTDSRHPPAAARDFCPSGSPRVNSPQLKIPHMGYNELEFHQPCPLLDGVEEGASVYFVHSYRAFTDERYVAAYVDYGGKIPALVWCKNLFGAQFHPEKSGEPGLTLLRNFAAL